ncbi:serpin family protein [Amycolatopsis echigonensis]|uniref:Serpin family protein n=1 Tax=Amycolatopsis echigonensis TaxID=2576905 RepID=A0A8E1VYB7_9PSEU|nr:serpin family protein [Amycolatopsis echigonensis]MBB2500412.1 serpin family protein [Amycolatopsis echigonensis]
MALDSHLTFTLALHGATAPPGSDACFSPYSAASALGLAEQAARGRTAEELAGVLGRDQSGLLHAAAEPGDDVQLAVANTLWASDRIAVEDSFQAALVRWPGGKAETAPFETDPEGARERINTDVDQTTHGLIPELLPEGAIHPHTRASLVNALYLKTAWRHPFPERATSDADFHTPEGVRQVPTMHLDESVGYAHENGWEVVRLAAEGGVETVILLPDGDLESAEAALDGQSLRALVESPKQHKIQLSLPKISLDVRADLERALQGLGVRELFTQDADLTGLTPDRPLWVDSILHQAVLRLDEQGLEGAAATAIQMRTMSLISAEPLEVRVDRPFLLLVRHAETGAVYFFARVVRPA